MAVKERAFTGLKPTGNLHLGNYFGTLKQVLDTYLHYETFLCVVDYHALTTVRDSSALQRDIVDMARDYLAAGIDPEKAIIFQQSQVSEHTELAWVLDCITPVSMLQLAHAYKDAIANGKDADTGLFTYPVLMTADIVLYDTDVVPVGEDQRQHVEYARDIAGKFNRTFGETFKEPREQILKSVAVVPGTDGRKMSKSYKNTIYISATKDQIAESVMSIITDSKGDRPENVYAIHNLFKSEKELAPIYESNRGNYQALKKVLIEDIDEYFAPFRERRNAITDTEVKKVLATGSEKARAIASAKMKTVRERIGVAL